MADEFAEALSHLEWLLKLAECRYPYYKTSTRIYDIERFIASYLAAAAN